MREARQAFLREADEKTAVVSDPELRTALRERAATHCALKAVARASTNAHLVCNLLSLYLQK